MCACIIDKNIQQHMCTDYCFCPFKLVLEFFKCCNQLSQSLVKVDLRHLSGNPISKADTDSFCEDDPPSRQTMHLPHQLVCGLVQEIISTNDHQQLEAPENAGISYCTMP